VLAICERYLHCGWQAISSQALG